MCYGGQESTEWSNKLGFREGSPDSPPLYAVLSIMISRMIRKRVEGIEIKFDSSFTRGFSLKRSDMRAPDRLTIFDLYFADDLTVPHL